MFIDDKEVLIKLHGKKYHCAMDITMDFIGGKWKTVVLWYLKNGKKRYGELKKQVPQMTDRVLSIQLKKLEENGIIKREVFNSKPPLKVEYSLTSFGKTLIPVLESIAKWGRELGQSEGEMIENSYIKK